MSEILPSETEKSALPDADLARIDAILAFWFKEHAMTAPQIDRRMDIWFGEDEVFDLECKKEFSHDVDQASAGELDHWAEDSRGRLALILLLDQFRRNIYRNTADAFAMDKAALKLCVEGARDKKDRGLTPIQQAFFYMPLQHAESLKAQEMAVEIFNRLCGAVSATYRETFETMATFAELHRDIIQQFSRFPHRNQLLGRENTPEEDEYLASDTPDFGQGP